MPRSAVLYTSRETFSRLTGLLQAAFRKEHPVPYTLSFPSKAGTDVVRVRITELDEDAITPIFDEVSRTGDVTLASAGDRDVTAAGYEEIMESADRFTRTATLQFSSPAVMEFAGQAVPFPVVPLMFEHYIDVWNRFSAGCITRGREGLRHVHVIDFSVSCAPSAWGPGFRGWIVLEMEKGRTEAEIALFNALLDFAFYCGTGIYTEKGLGQTRRMKKQQGAVRTRTAAGRGSGGLYL